MGFETNGEEIQPLLKKEFMDTLKAIKYYMSPGQNLRGRIV